MKILYITTIGETMCFFESFIHSLLLEGHEVDIATNEMEGKSSVPTCYRKWNCNVFHLSCTRSPIDFANLKAINEIETIIQNRNYDIVNCNTPIASVCSRLACKKIKNHRFSVIYTAHGFHFFKGAPIKNWLLFYPIEKSAPNHLFFFLWGSYLLEKISG